MRWIGGPAATSGRRGRRTRLQSTLRSAAVDDVRPRGGPAGRQRDAGVRRDRRDRGDAGHDLEARCRPWRSASASSGRGVDERVAVHQPDDAGAPRLGRLRRPACARAAWVSGWPSSPKPPSTSSTLGASRTGATHQAACSGDLGRRRRRPSRAARRRAPSAGRGRRGRRRRRRPSRGCRLRGATVPEVGLRRCGLVVRSRVTGVLRLPSTIRSCGALVEQSAARARPRAAGVDRGAGGGQSDGARAVGGQRRPRAARARRRRRPRPPRPSAPTGAEQPASSAASRARSAVTAARVCGVVERASGREPVARVVGAALDRQRALAGGGEHLERVERPRWPRRAGRAGRARRGPGRRRRRRRRATLPEPGVDVAADGDDLEAEPEGARAGRPGAASRCRPGSRPAARRGSARRGPRARRAGPRAAGTAASAMPSAGRGRQVLERVHGEVDVAVEQRVAQRADEDAGAADRGQRRARSGRRRW